MPLILYLIKLGNCIYCKKLSSEGEKTHIIQNDYDDQHCSKCYSPHDTWAATWQNQHNDLSPVKTDQPGYLPNLIRVLAVRMKKDWVLSDSLSAQWSDGRMPRLIWVFAGHTVILLLLSCFAHMYLHHCVLQEGGEFYFSDMYCDRDLPEEARKHEVLWGNCWNCSIYCENQNNSDT